MPQNTFPGKIIACIFADLSIFKALVMHSSSEKITDTKYHKNCFIEVLLHHPCQI